MTENLGALLPAGCRRFLHPKFNARRGEAHSPSELALRRCRNSLHPAGARKRASGLVKAWFANDSESESFTPPKVHLS